jgi:CBS domain-containing protein
MAAAKIGALPVVEQGKLVGIITTIDVLAGEVRDAMEPARRLRVGDVMSHPPVTVSSDAPISELAPLFADRTINALPVLDSDGKLVGMLSYVDALRSLAGHPRADQAR